MTIYIRNVPPENHIFLRDHNVLMDLTFGLKIANSLALCIARSCNLNALSQPGAQ